MSVLSQTAGVLRKDLLLDWRSRGRALSVFAFAVTTLLLFSFASGADVADPGPMVGAWLWLALLFASVLALAESFRVETEDGGLEQLRLLPVDPRALFFGKAIANALLLLALGLLIFPLCLGLFRAHVEGSWPALVGTVALGAAGLAGPGTVYAAMTAQARGKDVMLPLLLFPLVVPVLVAAVKATTLCLGRDAMNQLPSWLGLLAIFDVVYWSLCPVLFGRVLEE
ncbi:MAG: heme exporter protein CcmB [Deltaproteobacteria bacterium]|nr:heme exporter protein CcmB [Deltaproteobacteria bacterium]MCB9785458.1 heme exporter protein CcmB [Deltaproteobacteria bacterium]